MKRHCDTSGAEQRASEAEQRFTTNSSTSSNAAQPASPSGAAQPASSSSAALPASSSSAAQPAALDAASSSRGVPPNIGT